MLKPGRLSDNQQCSRYEVARFVKDWSKTGVGEEIFRPGETELADLTRQLYLNPA